MFSVNAPTLHFQLLLSGDAVVEATPPALDAWLCVVQSVTSVSQVSAVIWTDMAGVCHDIRRSNV